jgi:hypothetical protein
MAGPRRSRRNCAIDAANHYLIGYGRYPIVEARTADAIIAAIARPWT